MPTQDQYIFQYNEHFELVLKGLDAGVYELDLEKKTFWWSSKFYELLGYKRGEIAPNKQQFLDMFVFSEDQKKLADIFDCDPAIAQPFILEIRLLHHNGKYRWYQIAGQANYKPQGKAYLIGSLRDIQLRVEQQEQNKKTSSF